MIESIHVVTDADLDTYVDDQLDASRGIEVEAYLSSNPDVAARVMSDLRTRDELRLALAGLRGAPGPATNEAARRLERGLARGRLLGGLQPCGGRWRLRCDRLGGACGLRPEAGHASRRVNAASALRSGCADGPQDSDRPRHNGFAA